MDQHAAVAQVSATWLGTGLPYTLLPPYFGFPLLKGPTAAAAVPQAAACGVPLVMGMQQQWPSAPAAVHHPPPASAAVPVPCMQPLSPVSNPSYELSPRSAPCNDDTRSVPSAGSPKGSDVDDLAVAQLSADEMESRRAAQNKAEKERRNILKSGFEELKAMVPDCGKGGHSKAKILHRAVDYVSDLVREKTSLLQEAEKLRAEVQHLRSILRQYEEMDGLPPAERAEHMQHMQELENRTRSLDSVDIKFYVFCCVIDKLYETFCQTVSLENSEVFSSSLLQWFKGYCNTETFLKPLQAIGSRFFPSDNATIQRCKSTLTLGKNAVVMMLDEGGRRGVPMARQLGATIDYVTGGGALCIQEPAATA